MRKQLWIAPAVASLAFFLFSIEVVIAEGPLGFLDEHLRTAWGAQIGVDLVLAVIMGLCLAVPLARRAGVRPLPWVLLTMVTGSIGLFAFVARVLYARAAAEVDAQGDADESMSAAVGSRST